MESIPYLVKETKLVIKLVLGIADNSAIPLVFHQMIRSLFMYYSSIFTAEVMAIKEGIYYINQFEWCI